MYIFGLLFIIFVNFSAFSMVTPLDSTAIPSQAALSCIPPQAESSLVNSPATSSMITVTVSQSSPPTARHFKSFQKLTFEKEKVLIPKRNSRKELALDRVSEEEAIRLQKIVAEEETAVYLAYPSARRAGTSPLALAWAQRHNDSYCPSETR